MRYFFPVFPFLDRLTCTRTYGLYEHFTYRQHNNVHVCCKNQVANSFSLIHIVFQIADITVTIYYYHNRCITRTNENHECLKNAMFNPHRCITHTLIFFLFSIYFTLSLHKKALYMLLEMILH